MCTEHDSDEFEARLFLSSVQLVRVGEGKTPNGIASGALIDYEEKRLLLTVEHATGDQGEWAMQLRYVPGRGSELYRLGPMNFLKKFSLKTGSAKTIDFAYVDVPDTIRPLRQEVDPATCEIGRELPITIHRPKLTDIPVAGESYGFCGMVSPVLENHVDRVFFEGQIRIYNDLKFLRTEDDFHYFSLPFAHPGHEHFQGCSGAPVLGSNGALVGLLCGGCVKTNEIRVLSLSAYKVAIDSHVNSLHYDG